MIRKLSFIPKLGYLVSVSEDCLINLWQVNKINFSNTVSDLEPIYTFRGHTGPLYSLETKDELIYTAGNEGIIKIWRVPRYSEVSPYGDSEILFNCNIAFLHKTQEVVWDIKHHPTKNLLVSLASDGNAYFWKTSTADEYLQSLSDNKLDKWFLSSTKCGNGDVNPTTGCFLTSDNSIFASGLTDGNISFIDCNKYSVVSNTKNTKHFSAILKNKPTSIYSIHNSSHQVNTIKCSSNMIYAGFDDGTVRNFDYRTENSYTPVACHDDSVTSISIFDDLYLFTTSHDTRVKMWDIRDMSQPVCEAISSQKKWDEAIWDSLFLNDVMALATAGADSVIRVFKV